MRSTKEVPHSTHAVLPESIEKYDVFARVGAREGQKYQKLEV
jgi:hypothetical protein